MVKRVILGVFFVSVVAFSQTNYKNQTIEEILKLPEEQINLSIASLVLAKDFYPNLNVNNFLYTIGYMTDKYKYYFGGYTDPDKRISAMNTYLYRKIGRAHV